VLSILLLPFRVVLLPVTVVRAIASMRFTTVLSILGGAGVAFLGARHLLASDQNVEQLPEPLRAPARSLRRWLLGRRAQLAEAQRAYHEGEAEAEHDLRQDYLSRTGRQSG